MHINYFYFYHIKFFSLKDTEAYVRKTAAVCVAKLFNINPTLVIDRYFYMMSKLYLLNLKKGLYFAVTTAT
jgi:hypothetical protein